MAVEGIDPRKLTRFPIESYDVRVIDGDTIELSRGREKRNVRLAGIDAPETAKKGIGSGGSGALASISYLNTIITQYRSQLQLYIVPGSETYGRMVGVLVAGSLNVNLALVRRGLVGSYVPEGGIDGVQTGLFRAAERQAVQKQIGIFADEQYRLQWAMNRIKGDVSNVRLQDPERQANDWQARIRAGTVKGLRSASHHENVPHGIQGMKPGRADFPGGRMPHNPDSMSLLRDQAAFEKASRFLRQFEESNAFSFLDVETTGLRAQEFVTEFAAVRGNQLYNVAMTPALNYYTNESAVLGLAAPYDTDAARRASNQYLYRGSRLTRNLTPGMGQFFSGKSAGDPFTYEDIELLLSQSNMDVASKRRQIDHLQRLRASGNVANLEDAVSSFLGDLEPNKNQWLFVHNPYFEARRIGAAFTESQWEELVTSGRVAAGSLTYKSIYQPFDMTMKNLLDQAREIERDPARTMDGAKKAAGMRWDWYTKLSEYIRTGGGPQGLKVVDVQDVAKAVFGKAGLVDDAFSMISTHGIMSQDVLGRLMGLSPEQHTAYHDALQSKIVTAKLLEYGEALRTGQMTDEMHQFFTAAKEIQPTMSVWSIQKDIANRVADFQKRGITSIDDMYALVKQGEQSVLELDDFFIGGQKQTGATIKFYDLAGDATEAEVPLAEYVKGRLAQAGWRADDTLAREMVEEVAGSVDLFQAGGGRDIAEDVLSRKGGFILLPKNDPSVIRGRILMSLFERSGEKTASAASVGDAARSAWTDAVSGLKAVPDILKSKFNALPPRAKAGISIAAGVMALIGTAGAIRSSFEEEREAEFETLDLEAHLVNRQVQDVTNFVGVNTDISEMVNQGRRLSDLLLRAQKQPGRYYPSRQLNA